MQFSSNLKTTVIAPLAIALALTSVTSASAKIGAGDTSNYQSLQVHAAACKVAPCPTASPNLGDILKPQHLIHKPANLDSGEEFYIHEVYFRWPWQKKKKNVDRPKCC